MKILLALFAFLALAYAQECPAFGDWKEQSECLWWPLREMRQKMFDSCDVDFDASTLPSPPNDIFTPEILAELRQVQKCGYCSFKFQCRKREYSDGCWPLQGKKEICTEHSGVCDLPKAPLINSCKWGIFTMFIKQCINRPESEVPEWKRDEIRKLGHMLPESNCVEKDGRCKCCCHPYKPTADGTSCQLVQAPICQDFGDWNDWSQCMWGMPQAIVADFRSHCGIDVKAGADVTKDVKVKLPEGFALPDKCGYCSFKVRCRKRDRTDAAGQPRCFPVESDKRACGESDCDTCHQVCTFPKIRDSCDYGKHVRGFLKGKISKIDKMPYWRKRGMIGIAKNLPKPKCVEKDGTCKCCCHPYEPTADGTACELKPYCKMPSDLGINIFEQD